MTHTEEIYSDLSGYERCGRITITYNFPDGRQGVSYFVINEVDFKKIDIVR